MRIALSFILVVALAATGSAQYAHGDMIVLDQNSTSSTWSLLGITPQGQVYTVTPSLTLSAWSVMPAPDNRSMWVSGKGINGYTTSSVAPDGTITNVNVDFNNLFGAMDVDDTGAAVLGNLVGPELLRYQQNQLTTIFSGSPLGSTIGGGIDTASGDFIIVQSGSVVRATLTTPVQVSTLVSMPSRGGTGGAHYDPDNASMLLGYGTSLHQLSLTSPPALVTINVSAGGSIGGLDRDVRNDEFAIAVSGTTPRVLRYDGRQQSITSIIPLTGSAPTGVAIASSRFLAAGAPATPGASFPMLVSSPNEVGAAYVTALSFGLSTGAPLPGGKRLYLVPDALFQLSLTNAGIFRNFQGTLNSRGEGYPILDLPNIGALSGIRFYATAATLYPSGIGLVTEPVGITIR